MDVRAKFRCLSITRTWDNKTTIELKPVYPNNGNREADERHAAENKTFWKATPIGECRLNYDGEAPFEPGAYYYIDFKPSESGWELYSVGETVHSLAVEFVLSFDTVRQPKFGNLKMSIDNREAWPAFQGKVEQKWAIAFSPAL